MGKRNKSGLRRGFGVDENGQPLVPAKIGNVRMSRIENSNDRGCSYCFPHGRETDNATEEKNTRSWKLGRMTRYRPPREDV